MILYIFVPSDLDLSLLDIKFPPLVILIQRYVYTKLEVYSYGFPASRKSEAWDERTDRRTGCNT